MDRDDAAYALVHVERARLALASLAGGYRATEAAEDIAAELRKALDLITPAKQDRLALETALRMSDSER